jgi:PAS domain S-box-containing protein
MSQPSGSLTLPSAPDVADLGPLTIDWDVLDRNIVDYEVSNYSDPLLADLPLGTFAPVVPAHPSSSAAHSSDSILDASLSDMAHSHYSADTDMFLDPLAFNRVVLDTNAEALSEAMPVSWMNDPMLIPPSMDHQLSVKSVGSVGFPHDVPSLHPPSHTAMTGATTSAFVPSASVMDIAPDLVRLPSADHTVPAMPGVAGFSTGPTHSSDSLLSPGGVPSIRQHTKSGLFAPSTGALLSPPIGLAKVDEQGARWQHMAAGLDQLAGIASIAGTHSFSATDAEHNKLATVSSTSNSTSRSKSKPKSTSNSKATSKSKSKSKPKSKSKSGNTNETYESPNVALDDPDLKRIRHNEIESRRRNTMKSLVVELGEVALAGTKKQGQILVAATERIRTLRETLQSLQKERDERARNIQRTQRKHQQDNRKAAAAAAAAAGSSALDTPLYHHGHAWTAGPFTDYRLAFQNSAVALDAVSLNGVVVDVSHRYLELLGRSRSRVIGKSLFDYATRPPNMSSHDSIINKLFDDGIVQQYRMELIHQDGSRVAVEATSWCVKVDGKRKLICNMFIPVSDPEQGDLLRIGTNAVAAAVATQ